MVDIAKDAVDAVEVLEIMRRVAGGNVGAKIGTLFINSGPSNGDGLGRKKRGVREVIRPGVVEITMEWAGLEPGSTMSSQDSRRNESITGDKPGMLFSCLIQTSPPPPTGTRTLLRVFSSGEIALLESPDPLVSIKC